MTVISAPRMIPRMRQFLDVVSGAQRLVPSPFYLPLQIRTFARRRRRRMAADRLPPSVVLDPYVGQQDAILDHPAEIFEPPAGVDRADHDVAEGGRVAHLELDRVDLAPLDRVEPFVAVHHERAARAGADEHEVLVNERAQLIHVLAAQGVAPFALEPFDHCTRLVGHASPLLPL